MRGLGETLVFASAALALHLALWPAERPVGADSAGGGGDDLVTLSPASAAVANAVAQWDRPPEAALPEPAAFIAPPATDMTPAIRQQEAAPTSPAMPPRPAAPISAPTLPRIEPTPQRPARVAEPDPRPTVAQALPDTPRPAPRPVSPPKRQDSRQPTQAAQTAAAPSSASADQAARRAAGAGGDVSGRSRQAQSATLSPDRARSLLAEWGGQIRTRIARSVPRGAGSGTAVVELTVAADGVLLDARLIRSSGNPRLDDLALTAVRRAGRFPAAPAALGLRRQSFTLPVKAR
ncbi:energy transducer TonB [Rhodovulum sp.]|uniref:energy transducer TonB n=1 Tax=Rhodovulum sp. TaxID=34009 RepID=UPI001858482D|nr:energy transducer TonB [Rhodovulum sp.]HDR27779.1 TonB family protein [Rhodovulum sp.]